VTSEPAGSPVPDVPAAETAETAEAVAAADALLAAGDVPGLIRHLRARGAALPLSDFVRILRDAARSMEFEDLAQAAQSVLAAEPGSEEQAAALYGFGYECIERGIAFLAVRPLSEAVAVAPGVLQLRTELAAAYERAWRHSEAVATLRDFRGELNWLGRYQLTYNALMAGDLVAAEEAFAALPVPEEEGMAPFREQVRTMLTRAAAVRVTAGGLGPADLRGWHFALTGGVLLNISPYGFDAGMTGRWAMVGDSHEACAEALRRLAVVLAARGLRPLTVSVLPDRDSRIMGLAAARFYGLPTVPFEPGRPDTLVVAYDLDDVDAEIRAALRERAAGQILFERAADWTDPPSVAPDVIGFLRQAVVTPWGTKLQLTGGPEPDPRPAEEIAADLAATKPAVDEGDGKTPPDPDSALETFVHAVGESWLAAPREYVASPGPVPSSRFL
jgi:hypothetical protein